MKLLLSFLCLQVASAFRVLSRTCIPFPLSVLSCRDGRGPVPGRFSCGSTACTACSDTAAAAQERSEEKIFGDGLFEGIKRDYKMRLPLLKSDFTDGINVQSLAATMFLFFACLAPAVGFGGLFGIATNGAIGTVVSSRIYHVDSRGNCSCSLIRFYSLQHRK
jgi:hypothetical protein